MANYSAYILFLICTITTVASQLLFKKGTASFGDNISLNKPFELIKTVLTTPVFLIGLFLYGISFLLWLMVIKKLPLNVAYPMSSLNFIIVFFLSWIFLGESVNALKIVGVLTICAGIILLFKGNA